MSTVDILGPPPEFVSDAISPQERMPHEDVPGYLAVGRSALRAVRLAQYAARIPDFSSILDFACGHGRVMRWFRAAFPNARLTAVDILPEGVRWCSDRFGAKGMLSTPQLDASAFDDAFDLIWVGSLLTHVDVPVWHRLIGLWAELLAPNGLLIVTTHGEFVAQRMRNGELYGYPRPQIVRMLRAYDHAGFAFLEESPTSVDYGITVARPEWVLDVVLARRELRVVMAAEMLWDDHQDVYAFVNRRLDTGNRPI